MAKGSKKNNVTQSLERCLENLRGRPGEAVKWFSTKVPGFAAKSLTCDFVFVHSIFNDHQKEVFPKCENKSSGREDLMCDGSFRRGLSCPFWASQEETLKHSSSSFTWFNFEQTNQDLFKDEPQVAMSMTITHKKEQGAATAKGSTFLWGPWLGENWPVISKVRPGFPLTVDRHTL